VPLLERASSANSPSAVLNTINDVYRKTHVEASLNPARRVTQCFLIVFIRIGFAPPFFGDYLLNPVVRRLENMPQREHEFSACNGIWLYDFGER
jgi:hypothetical protein